MKLSSVQLGGLLGDALNANRRGRLDRFITDETSPALALFEPTRAAHNVQGDWYGEHAGKWLYAAAKSARRTHDHQLADRVRRVADFLVRIQRSDGYLGTYAPERRFTTKASPPGSTWDGAPSARTWDVWVHAYLMLGLLEVHKYTGDRRYLDTVRLIGDLCLKALTVQGIDITHLGNHHGLSATVLLDAAVELYFATCEQRYLTLAHTILDQAERRPELRLLSKALEGADASDIATGKAYQLIWNVTGIAKLYRACGDERLLTAVLNVWQSIQRSHLTLGGGPWGGVGLRSREIFNPPTIFSPEGYVETCSTLAWIQLNRELLAITHQAKFADEIERAAYNDLLGAQAPDGADWCYYSFPNGKRVFTTYWRCCKSSGAMALEELPDVAYQGNDEGITINIYGAGTARLETSDGTIVNLEQITDYPFGGDIRVRVSPESTSRFVVKLRIPAWAGSTSVQVNGVDAEQRAVAGTYLALNREWCSNDEITIAFPMAVTLHHQSNRSIQESIAPDHSSISQEVMRHDYVALSRGPLVYATGLIDGFKTAETISLGDKPRLDVIDRSAKSQAPMIRLGLGNRSPLSFVPYYEAGGRSDGTWRLTWLQVEQRSDAPVMLDR